MASGAVADRDVPRRQPGVRAAEIAARRRGAREGAVQGELLAVPRRNDGAVRPRSPGRSLLESWGDAESVRGSVSLQQPAMDRVFDTRATADVLHRRHQGDPATASRIRAADYRSWLIRTLPGRGEGVRVRRSRAAWRQASPAEHRCASNRRRRAASGAGTTRGATGRLLPTSCIRRPCSATAARPTSHGSRSCPTRSRRSRGSPGSRFIRPPRRASASKTATTSPSTTAAGSVTAPVYVYLGVRPDVVAMADGSRPHRVRPLCAERRASNAVRCAAVSRTTRAAVSRSRRSRPEVTKTADHSPIVSTEGSARQHARGIGRAVTRRRIERPRGRGSRALCRATTSTTSCQDFGRPSRTTHRAC